MQHEIGETAQALQAGAIVEVGEQRSGSSRPPLGSAARIAQQGENAMAAGKMGENAAGYVPATDNQDFLHAGIVADGLKGNT